METLNKIHYVISKQLTYVGAFQDGYSDLSQRDLWNTLREKAKLIWMDHQSKANRTPQIIKFFSGQTRNLEQIQWAYQCIENLFGPSLIVLPKDIHEIILQKLSFLELPAIARTTKALYKLAEEEFVRKAREAGWVGDDPKVAKIWLHANVKTFQLLDRLKCLPDELYSEEPKYRKFLDFETSLQWKKNNPEKFKMLCFQNHFHQFSNEDFAYLFMACSNPNYVKFAERIPGWYTETT